MQQKAYNFTSGENLQAHISRYYCTVCTSFRCYCLAPGKGLVYRSGGRRAKQWKVADMAELGGENLGKNGQNIDHKFTAISERKRKLKLNSQV